MPAKCPHTQLDSFIIPVGSEDSSVCSKTPQLSAIVPNQPGVFELRRDSGFLWNHQTDTCHQLDPEQCGKYPQVFLRALAQSNTGSLCSRTNQFHCPVWSESAEHEASGGARSEPSVSLCCVLL